MPLRIHLLGPFQVESEGTSLRLPPRSKVSSLWAYLLLHAQDELLRTSVAYTLWPDEPEAKARSNLRRDLHRLQGLLPSTAEVPWLLLKGERMRWNPAAPAWIDALEFDRLAKDEGTLEEAAALYRGDLLDGVYEDWVLGERERYQVRYLGMLARLAHIKREAGELDSAVGYALRLLALEPLSEDLLRLLMSLKYQSGDRAGALREYERFALRLEGELQTEPMPETVALKRAVELNAPLPAMPSAQRPLQDEGPDLPAVSPRLPLVGRDDELAQLSTRWGRATRGQGGMVFLSGESGIGKSRLASEAAFLAERQGGRVLYGAASPSEPSPYEALMGVLQRSLPYLEGLTLKDVTWSSLSRVLPEVRDFRPSAAEPVALDPGRERQRLFQAVLEVLEALARVRPLLILLEDLHWAGASTIDLLSYIAQHLAHRPVLVVCTYREEDVGRAHPLRGLRRDLVRGRLALQIRLRRLSLADVEQLLDRLPEETAPDVVTLARELFDESEGHPLFLVERLNSLRESLGGAGLRPVELLRREIPRSVEEAILARLDRLPPGAQSVVELASVIGLSLDVELLRELSGWPEADVADALQALMDRQILREAGASSGFDFTFAHHLIQEAAYRRMSDATRRRRHRSLAHVVEELYSGDPGPRAATLAHHFDLGGEPARAAGYFLLAAQRALALYADEEALELASAGRQRATDPEGRFALVGLLETVYARRGDRARQSDALAAMETEASHLTAHEECEVLLRRIQLHRGLGEREAEGSRIEDLSQRADVAGLRLWQTRALQAQATWLTERGDYEAARAIAQQALDHFSADGDAGGQVESLCSLAEVSVLQGDFGAVPPLVERALRLATAESNQSLVVHCLRAASAGAFARQDFEASIALGTQMEELCRRIGDLEGEADALTRLGSARARLFLVDEARRHYAEAARLYRRLGKRQGEGAVLINAGFLLTWLGLYDEARASYENADAIFRAIDDRRGQVISLLNLGMVELYQSHPGPAREAASRALELARRMESQPMVASALANLGAAERDLGETRSAIEHMQEGLALRRSLGQLAEMANDLSDLAIAYLDDGRAAEARTACEEMLRLLEESPASVMHPQYVLWSAAQTAWAEGREAEARRLLEEAREALSTKAAAIPDDVSRQAFLTLPFNGELTEALRTGRWPRGRTARD